MADVIDELEALLPPLARPAPFRFSRSCVSQYEEMECGAACLSTISAHYGNELPVSFWRERLRINQEGTSLFDIISAAERTGFVAHGVEIESIARVAPSVFPLIALREQHYVVVHGVRAEEILVANPAEGLRWVPRAEFEEGFEGHVVVLRPTEAFYAQRPPPRRYKHLAAMFAGHGRELTLILGCSLGLTVLGVVPAFLSQFIMDEVLPKKDAVLLAYGIGAAYGIGMLMNALSWLRSYYLSFLSSRFDLGSSSRFMRTLFDLPYSFFATRHVGDFTHRLGEMSRLRDFVTSDLMGTMLDFMNLSVYGTLLWLYNPPVAALVFVSAPLLVGLSALFSKRLMTHYNRTFVASANQDSLVADQIKGIATIKTLDAGAASRWRFEDSIVEALKARFDFEMTAARLNAFSNLLNETIGYAIMALAALMAVRGRMTPGQTLSVSILAGGVVGPFHSIASTWSSIKELQVLIDRLNDVLLAEPEAAAVTKSAGRRPARLRGEIEFQDVWFRYGGESSDWALKGVTFVARPGQSVAIVGASGSGKSTVALLATRLYEPTKGRIVIDGCDSREYDQRWLRRQLGLVLQETNLFHGSLLANIALATARPDVERVDRAAAAADAKDFILKKGRGYDYRITHGGRGLSGGQKQRIAIARILYADPAILFLDEATSSLDARSERAIIAALRAERPDRTIVSIAHRQATVLRSDFAVVLEGGVVVETGTHRDLLKSGRTYASLFGQLAGEGS